ncbi:unnamed protein product [Auanema sp. JU1783]|nr:unnamed protein product [Auanema sp. JU1783]
MVMRKTILALIVLLTIQCLPAQGCQNCEDERLNEIMDTLRKQVPRPHYHGHKHGASDASAFVEANSELLTAFSENDIDQDDPVTKKLLVASDPYQESTISHPLAAFNLSPEVFPYDIIQARLFVYLNLQGHLIGSERSVDISVWEMTKDNIKKKELAKKKVKVSTPTYFIVDLASEDIERIKSRGSPGIFVQALVDGKNIAIHPQDGKQERNMMLDLSVRGNDIVKNRLRRSTDLCGYGNNNGSCCREDLMINFKDMGWEFVVAPVQFNAYKCTGGCSDYNFDEHTRHAHGVLTQRADKNLLCCHPSEYSPLRLVYVNNDNTITVSNLQNLVVTRCVCG